MEKTIGQDHLHLPSYSKTYIKVNIGLVGLI